MLKNYLKIAWKVLGRNKFFTFVSLFGISCTIGVLLVLTSLVDSVFGVHYPDMKRNRSLYVTNAKQTNDKGWSNSSASSFYFLDHFVKKMKTPELIALTSDADRTNTFVGEKKLTLNLKYTCENFWKIYEFDFLEGRNYEKQQLDNNEHLAVISEATKVAYFGEGEVVGKYIETDNTRYQVIGVVKNVPITQLIAYGDIYVPYTTAKGGLSDQLFIGGYRGIILARNKADFPQIKAEFQSMVDRVQLPPDSDYTNFFSWAWTPLEGFSQGMNNNNEPNIGLLYTIVIVAMLLFMLLPALNLVNLNGSRILERSSEIGIRKAFGATSSTLALQFIIENLALTLIGGVIGLLLAFGTLQIVESSQLIKHAEFYINYKVFLMAVFLCLVFGILSGVLPAVRMSKIKIVNALNKKLA